MPVHQIFHPPGIYTNEEKASIAAKITAIYTGPRASLPGFFVDVIFHPIAADNFYVAGKPRSNFVRIIVEHIARNSGGNVETMEKFMELYEEAVAGAARDKDGIDNWEIHVDETPRELWRIDGLRPPMREGESKFLEQWVKEEKAVAY